MNPNKIKAFLVSRSRTVSPPHGDLVSSVVSILASPNLDIIGVNFDSNFTFEDHLRGIVSPVFLGELVFWGWWNVYLWTHLFYFVDILHLFSQSFSIVLWCGGQLLNVTFSFLSARCIRWPGFVSIRISFRVAGRSMLYKVNSNPNNCLFSELPSASARVRYTRAAAAAHPLEFKVPRSRTYQYARSFLPTQVQLLNDIPYTVFI